MCVSAFTMETMKVSFMVRDYPSLSVRRAALTAMSSAFESWLQMKQRRQAYPPSFSSSLGNSHPQDVLGSLSDVTGMNNREALKGDVSMSEREEYSVVAMIVDWAIATSKIDADETCRVLKMEIVRVAIECFGLLEGEEEFNQS